MAENGFDIGAVDPSLAGYFGGGAMLPQVAQMASADPRRMLVQSMMQQGQHALEQPTLSPGAALAKALTVGLGGVSGAYLNHQYQDMNTGAVQAMQDAMNAPDIRTRMAILSKNPATMQMAWQQQNQIQAHRATLDAAAAKDHMVNVWGDDPWTPIAQHAIEGGGKAVADIEGPKSEATERGKLTAQGSPQGLKTAQDLSNINEAKDTRVNANKALDEASLKTTNLPPGTVTQPEHPELAGTAQAHAGRSAPGGKGAKPAPGTPLQPTVPPPPADGAPGANSPAPATPGAAGNSAASGPQNASGGTPAPIAASPYPPSSIQEGREKRYNEIQLAAQNSSQDLAFAQMLKDTLHKLGSGGPAVPFLTNLGRWAENMGLSKETIAQYTHLPPDAPDQEAIAAKMSRDLLGEVLKAQFPGRITNADITMWQNTVAGPGLPLAASDYLIDNVLTPKIKQNTDLARTLAKLRAGGDTALNGMDQAILDFNEQHPLKSYVPALNQPQLPDPKTLTPADRARLEAVMRKNGELK